MHTAAAQMLGKKHMLVNPHFYTILRLSATCAMQNATCAPDLSASLIEQTPLGPTANLPVSNLLVLRHKISGARGRTFPFDTPCSKFERTMQTTKQPAFLFIKIERGCKKDCPQVYFNKQNRNLHTVGISSAYRIQITSKI